MSEAQAARKQTTGRGAGSVCSTRIRATPAAWGGRLCVFHAQGLRAPGPFVEFCACSDLSVRVLKVSSSATCLGWLVLGETRVTTVLNALLLVWHWWSSMVEGSGSLPHMEDLPWSKRRSWGARTVLLAQVRATLVGPGGCICVCFTHGAGTRLFSRST